MQAAKPTSRSSLGGYESSSHIDVTSNIGLRLAVAGTLSTLYDPQDNLRGNVRISENVCFPEPNDRPPSSLEFAGLALVPRDVVPDLVYPVHGVGACLQP